MRYHSSTGTKAAARRGKALLATLAGGLCLAAATAQGAPTVFDAWQHQAVSRARPDVPGLPDAIAKATAASALQDIRAQQFINGQQGLSDQAFADGEVDYISARFTGPMAALALKAFLAITAQHSPESLRPIALPVTAPYPMAFCRMYGLYAKTVQQWAASNKKSDQQWCAYYGLFSPEIRATLAKKYDKRGVVPGLFLRTFETALFVGADELKNQGVRPDAVLQSIKPELCDHYRADNLRNCAIGRRTNPHGFVIAAQGTELVIPVRRDRKDLLWERLMEIPNGLPNIDAEKRRRLTESFYKYGWISFSIVMPQPALRGQQVAGALTTVCPTPEKLGSGKSLQTDLARVLADFKPIAAEKRDDLPVIFVVDRFPGRDLASGAFGLPQMPHSALRPTAAPGAVLPPGRALPDCVESPISADAHGVTVAGLLFARGLGLLEGYPVEKVVLRTLKDVTDQEFDRIFDHIRQLAVANKVIVNMSFVQQLAAKEDQEKFTLKFAQAFTAFQNNQDNIVLVVASGQSAGGSRGIRLQPPTCTTKTANADACTCAYFPSCLGGNPKTVQFQRLATTLVIGWSRLEEMQAQDQPVLRKYLHVPQSHYGGDVVSADAVGGPFVVPIVMGDPLMEGYMQAEGSSYSAAATTAVAAVLWAKRPEKTAADVVEALLFSAQPLWSDNGVQLFMNAQGIVRAGNITADGVLQMSGSWLRVSSDSPALELPFLEPKFPREYALPLSGNMALEISEQPKDENVSCDLSKSFRFIWVPPFSNRFSVACYRGKRLHLIGNASFALQASTRPTCYQSDGSGHLPYACLRTRHKNSTADEEIRLKDVYEVVRGY